MKFSKGIGIDTKSGMDFRSIFMLTLPMYYILVSSYTYFGTFIFDFARDVPFNFYGRATQQLIIEAILIIIFASIAYLLGWWFAKPFKRVVYSSKNNYSNKIQIIIILNIITIFIYLYGYSIDGLIERAGYLNSTEPGEVEKIMLSLNYILLPIAIFGLTYINKKTIRWFFLLCHATLMLASSTRLLGLIFVIYSLGRLHNNGYKLTVKFFIGLFFGIYLFIWILAIRNNPVQGFYSNIISLFSEGLSLDVVWLGINYITSFSVYGFALAIEPKDIDYYSLMVSFSPLPLSFHDGIRMIESQTIIDGIPAPESAIAIVYRCGILFLTFFYITLGFLVNIATRNLNPKSLLTMAVLAIFIFATIFSLQYNLRGFIRLITLAVFFIVLSNYLQRIRFKLI